MDSDHENPLGTIQIVHETDRFLAVCKPGGLLTQAPSGIDSVEVRIKRYLDHPSRTYEPNRKNGKVYLGVPHRLDRPASGVMVFAKDKKAARFLAEQFQRREVKKTYWALVEGQGQPPQGQWNDWMRKVPGEARSEICGANAEGAQSAVLSCRILQSLDDCTLLEIDLHTGRSHQIRLQASAHGFSIVGDPLYLSTIEFGPQTDDQRLRCIALHARQLDIVDPANKEAVSLIADPPAYWPAVEVSGAAATETNAENENP